MDLLRYKNYKRTFYRENWAKLLTKSQYVGISIMFSVFTLDFAFKRYKANGFIPEITHKKALQHIPSEELAEVLENAIPKTLTKNVGLDVLENVATFLVKRPKEAREGPSKLKTALKEAFNGAKRVLQKLSQAAFGATIGLVYSFWSMPKVWLIYISLIFPSILILTVLKNQNSNLVNLVNLSEVLEVSMALAGKTALLKFPNRCFVFFRDGYLLGLEKEGFWEVLFFGNFLFQERLSLRNVVLDEIMMPFC